MGSTGLVAWDKLVQLNESWTSGRAVESIRVSWYSRQHINEDKERFHRKTRRFEIPIYIFLQPMSYLWHSSQLLRNREYRIYLRLAFMSQITRSKHSSQWDGFVILLYWIVSSLDRLIIEQIPFNDFDFPPTRDLALEAAALFRYSSPLHLIIPYTHTDVKDGYSTLSTHGSGRP